MSERGPVLVTGASGFVGRNLTPRLLRAGWGVRCLVHDERRLARGVRNRVEVVRGDVLDGRTLAAATEGASCAVYLVHFLAQAGDFAKLELEAAVKFSEAARKAGLQRVVYLGAAGRGKLSAHLESHQRVGELLRAPGLPVVELRSPIIVGAGSAAYEMARALVEHLPVIPVPRAAERFTRPIALEDALAFLLAALELRDHADHVLEIGGRTRASYADLLRLYADERELTRYVVPVPGLSASLGAGLLAAIDTPAARVAARLVAGLDSDTMTDPREAVELLGVQPSSLRATLAQAIRYSSAETPSWVPEALRGLFRTRPLVPAQGP